MDTEVSFSGGRNRVCVSTYAEFSRVMVRSSWVCRLAPQSWMPRRLGDGLCKWQMRRHRARYQGYLRTLNLLERAVLAVRNLKNLNS